MEARAELAVADLERAGGFDRANLLVATTTGSGWLDPGAVDSFEYLTGGDSAVVAMHGSSGLKVLAAIMGQELSMLAAPALSILLLLLGAFGLLDEELAVRLALWSGVVQLVGWGIDVGRRRGRAWPAALLAGLINGAFGLVIVVLEVLLH